MSPESLDMGMVKTHMMLKTKIVIRIKGRLPALNMAKAATFISAFRSGSKRHKTPPAMRT
jgi:hypothetical protein